MKQTSKFAVWMAFVLKNEYAFRGVLAQVCLHVPGDKKLNNRRGEVVPFAPWRPAEAGGETDPLPPGWRRHRTR